MPSSAARPADDNTTTSAGPSGVTGTPIYDQLRQETEDQWALVAYGIRPAEAAAAVADFYSRHPYQSM